MAKRRTKGEGTLYKDKSRDRWVGQIWLDGRWRKVSARTKSEASAKLGQLIHGDPSEQLTDRRLTVGQLLADWLTKHVEPSDRSPSTKEVQRWSVRILTKQIGPVKVSELDAAGVERMLARLTVGEGKDKRPMSRSSLIKARSTLRQALAWGERRRMVAHNAAAVAELPSEAGETKERRALTAGEVEVFTAAIEGHQFEAIWLLSLRAGLRPGEAAAVKVDALDLDGDPPTVDVVRGVRLVKGRPELVEELKTKGARRAIALPADLVEVLRRKVEALGPDDLLATSSNGGPAWPSTVRSDLAAICEAAGIEPITPNELRHTAATRLADQGVPPHVVADLLGHTTTRMVDAVYRHRPAVITGAL